MEDDAKSGQPTSKPSVWWYFERIKTVWDSLPRSAIVLYVLFLCSLYQVIYWEQFGISVWEHITVSDAAGRCVVPIVVVFFLLLLFLAPQDREQPALLKLDLRKSGHRWLHVAFRVISTLGIVGFLVFDLTSLEFFPISFTFTTLLLAVFAVVAVAIPSTEEAHGVVKNFRHGKAIGFILLSVLFSAGAGRLIGGLQVTYAEKPEVVFSDNDLALKLSWFRYIGTIGDKHVFTSIYPTRKTVLVNSNQVKAVIFQHPKYNPKQFKNADREKNGEEEYLIALSAFTGHNALRDPKLGFEYLSRSANAGSVPACYLLAICYRDGDGVGSDSKLYMVWLRKAAEGGSPEAQFLLAMVYWKGDGLPIDKEASFRWLLASATGGDNRAQRMLPLYYESGIGTQVNAVKAQAWRQVSGGSKSENPKESTIQNDLSRLVSAEVDAIRGEIDKRANQAK